MNKKNYLNRIYQLNVRSTGTSLVTTIPKIMVNLENLKNGDKISIKVVKVIRNYGD